MIHWSAEAHRRRLQNIGLAERSVRRALRRHLIRDYLPGQVTYNLGEYPCARPYEPSEADERLLDEYREAGVELIQVHEEWNDAQRLFGGDKFTPVNPSGLRRFLEMAHSRGLKVLLYASTGFFEMRDPDFRPEWARAGNVLAEAWYQYARCSPVSPSWRAYLLPRLLSLMDEWGADGIYNDCGYNRAAWNQPPTSDEVLAFEERPDHDAAIADLLALVYAEVKRRGGILKVHFSGTGAPRTELRTYDYLWVGEGVQDLDAQREVVKHHGPYVIPGFDLSRAQPAGEDELYLHTIPYLQFPLLIGGQPVTGERMMQPGLEYQDEATDFWTRHMRAIYRYAQEHPEGPRSYGWWDSVPGRPDAKERFFHWLRLYRPMVTAGTWAYLEIAESDLFRAALPKGVVASLFANKELWLVLANYGRSTVEVPTRDTYLPENMPGQPGTLFQVPARSLLILRRHEAG